MTDFATTTAVIDLSERLQRILRPAPLTRGDVTALVVAVIDGRLTSEVAALISKIAGEEYGSMRIAGQVMLAISKAPSVARDFYVQADVEAKRYVVVEVSREDGEPRKLDGLHVGTKGQEYAQGLVDEINRIGGAAFLVELAF